MKEGLRIAGKRPIGRFQFNALALIVIFTVYPFAIATIVNAGSSTDGEFHNAYGDESQGFGYYWENGGTNMTAAYDDGTLPSNLQDLCYIEEGYGNQDLGVQGRLYNTFDGSSLNSDFFMPYKEVLLKQTGHFCGTSNVIDFMGSGPYSWNFPAQSSNNFLTGIEDNETVDKLKFNFVDRFTFHNEASTEFTELDFTGDISFFYDNETLTYEEFQFTQENKYCYRAWDQQQGHWNDVCAIGLSVTFDFTGFESLEIDAFNLGNWDETGFRLTLNDFERTDGRNLGDTNLPFNGGDFFSFGAEYQSVNSVTAGFVIRSGTLLLSVGTFALAIASTPYWDPFKNLFKGVI